MLIRDYFERNMSITTSGHFSTRTLSNAIVEIGSDRILFAVDYPCVFLFSYMYLSSSRLHRYEDGLGEGCAWFDACDISDGDKRRIGRENSIKMFHLEDRLETGMTCHQLGIGGLRGNIYPEHAGHLRVNT